MAVGARQTLAYLGYLVAAIILGGGVTDLIVAIWPNSSWARGLAQLGSGVILYIIFNWVDPQKAIVSSTENSATYNRVPTSS